MGTPSEWEKYSFPKREEHFRSLNHNNDWIEEGEDNDDEEGEGKEGGEAGLELKEAQMGDLWFFDKHTRTIFSKDGKRKIALENLDTPSKVVRFLVTLEQRSDINPLPIIRALEQASQYVYQKPLTEILSHHAKNSSRMDWGNLDPSLSLSPVTGSR